MVRGINASKHHAHTTCMASHDIAYFVGGAEAYPWVRRRRTPGPGGALQRPEGCGAGAVRDGQQSQSKERVCAVH